MARKKRQKKKVTARDWGIVSLICRSGGKGRHTSKKHTARSTAKAAMKKSLMRNDTHEAFLFPNSYTFSPFSYLQTASSVLVTEKSRSNYTVA